jgi:hypothetical protein
MKNLIPVRKSTRATFRPCLESLENRFTPTTFNVTSLADSGEGSLRAGIASVNSLQANEIDFSVAGVIHLTSGALPAINALVKIDGRTAPGFVKSPAIEIDNNGFAGLVITPSASSTPNFSTVVSLSIVNASGPGLTLNATGITVIGNYMGLALDGSSAPNTGDGLLIDNSQSDTIGGTTAADRNVISANGGSGIQMNAGALANIIGNFIGTDPTGLLAAGNKGDGIHDNSAPSTDPIQRPNLIGGTDPGDANTIAFNSQSGVAVLPNTQTPILSNSIFSNAAQGIALLNESTPNLPAPQLSYAVESLGADPGSTQVQIGGVLNNSGTNGGQSTCTIQVFATLSGIPAGQGQVFLGSMDVTTNSVGFGSFTFRNLSVPAGVGTTFTATSTAISAGHFLPGNTSVFSTPIGTSTPNQAYVASVYQLLLDRIPDPSSSVWVNDLNNGASPASVVLGVQGSSEYLNDQVNAMYQLYLKRPADTAGAQFWVSFLEAGGTLEQVAEEITASQEYFVLQGGTNQGFITGLYAEVLNRTASNAEIAGWETVLDNGATRLDVSTAFLTSQEYRTDLVRTDYVTYLLRPADQAGLTFWLNAINAGATDQEVLAGIFGSPEGFQLWS